MAETKVNNPAAENDEDAALFEKRESVMLTPRMRCSPARRVA